MPYCMKGSYDLKITANFSLKLLLETDLEKLQSTRRAANVAFVFLDFRCHVSSVAARHTVIDYPTATL